MSFYGIGKIDSDVFIVMEFCSQGDLRNYLLTHEHKMPTPAVMNLALDVAAGMEFLHSKSPQIIHRDLAARNIFVITIHSFIDVLMSFFRFTLTVPITSELKLVTLDCLDSLKTIHTITSHTCQNFQ